LKGRLSAALDHKLGSDVRHWVGGLAVEEEPPVATTGQGGAQQQVEGQEEDQQQQQQHEQHQLDGQQQHNAEHEWDVETQAVEAGHNEFWGGFFDEAVEEELEVEGG